MNINTFDKYIIYIQIFIFSRKILICFLKKNQIQLLDVISVCNTYIKNNNFIKYTLNYNHIIFIIYTYKIIYYCLNML